MKVVPTPLIPTSLISTIINKPQSRLSSKWLKTAKHIIIFLLTITAMLGTALGVVVLCLTIDKTESSQLNYIHNNIQGSFADVDVIIQESAANGSISMWEYETITSAYEQACRDSQINAIHRDN